MGIRTINAPGVEIKEIDKSAYSPAMVGTACYVLGYTDKGEPYEPMEFTSKTAWLNSYGTPTNEAERYAYAAVSEVLDNNGRLYFARMAYDNAANGKMPCVTYDVGVNQSTVSLSDLMSQLSANDSTLSVGSNCLQISTLSISHESLLSVGMYLANELSVESNKLKIFDRTCGTYKKIVEDTRTGKNAEFLGLMPIVTTAADAMRIQNYIASSYGQLSCIEASKILSSTIIDHSQFISASVTSCYSDVSGSIAVTSVDNWFKTGLIEASISADLNKWQWKQTFSGSHYSTIYDGVCPFDNSNHILTAAFYNSPFELSSDDYGQMTFTVSNDISVWETTETTSVAHQLLSSDIAMPLSDVYEDALQNFTQINYTPNDSTVGTFDRTATKQIGIVVYQMYLDPGFDNKVNFNAVESFVGQLDPNAKDPTTNKSLYLPDIVNTNSKYIYAFAGNIAGIDDANFTYTGTLNAPSLGFYTDETVKQVSISSIVDSMNLCFQKNADINEREIDIVIDAGIANINSYCAANDSTSTGTKTYYDLTATDVMNKWSTAMQSNSQAIKQWKAIEQKFDTFCRQTRKDCMFIADGPRPLVLAGNKKIVRPTMPTNSIDANIIPFIKWTTGLNTNYGAGYIDWFEVADGNTGDLFWCPPSIKAAGVYINTDVNYNYWDAPAGLNRGKIAATDVAFSPTIKQAGAFYEKNWNYAINYPQDGIILEGQKTFQTAPTALDRVNVRRLLLRLERQAYKIGRYFVYEGNTAYTRQRLVDMLTPDFKECKIGGGLMDFKIICNESNNTPTSIDRNELHVAIGVKPTKTAEFIIFNFIVASTGVSWDEVM